MARPSRFDDMGMLSEDMAMSIMHKIGTFPSLDQVERVHVFYAVLDRCEDTGGRVSF